jgi:FAD binding domain
MSSSSISGDAQSHALESILSPSQIVSDPTALAAYAIDTLTPTIAAKPNTTDEAAVVVRFATKDKLVLIPSGNRTKLAIGSRPERYDIALDMTRLHQIAHYDPGDLTVSIGAGMQLAQLNAILIEHKQFIPLLVPYYFPVQLAARSPPALIPRCASSTAQPATFFLALSSSMAPAQSSKAVDGS